MQCVYDTEKAYFVFYVPGMYGEGEDHQMNAAISTMFKMGAEASLSNMVREYVCVGSNAQPCMFLTVFVNYIMWFHGISRVTVPLPTIAPRHSKHASLTRWIGSYCRHKRVVPSMISIR